MTRVGVVVGLLLLVVLTTTVMLLAASLLVTRRRPFLLAERARGASIAPVATRGLLESVPVVLIAVALATGGVLWWLHDQRGSALLAVAVAVVTALAPAVLAAREAAGAWTGHRGAADRRARAVQHARRGARRLVAEATVVMLVVAVVVEQAVRRRDKLGEVLRVGER